MLCIDEGFCLMLYSPVQDGYALFQMFEFKIALFQTLLVYGITIDQVVFKAFSVRLTELGATLGIDPIADGYKHIQVVEEPLSSYFPGPFFLNRSEIPNSSIGIQFTRINDM